MKLTIMTDPRRVAAHYRREGTLLAFEIPSSLDAAELLRLALNHARWPQRDCVLDLVVAHPACDLPLLERVVELAEDSPSVLNTVATCGKAPPALLHRLACSSSPSVREHAELALVDHELRHADDEGIARLYHEHRDHPSWGYGLRYRLVIDPRTPRAVLQSIASDHDPIGAQARRRLGQEATG